MSYDDEAQAQLVISQFRDNAISVIIRHGDASQETDIHIRRGRLAVLKPLKNGAVTARISDTAVLPYKDIADEHWAAANFNDAASGFGFLSEMDPDLKDTDLATVITLDLETLQYIPFPKM